MDTGELYAIIGNSEEEATMLDCKSISLMGIVDFEHVDGNTMHISGTIGDIPILILVDSEANHNFISPQVVSAVGLSFDDTRQFLVRLGNGHKISTGGQCSPFLLKLEDTEFPINAHILDLGVKDLILGVTWLRSLG